MYFDKIDANKFKLLQAKQEWYLLVLPPALPSKRLSPKKIPPVTTRRLRVDSVLFHNPCRSITEVHTYFHYECQLKQMEKSSSFGGLDRLDWAMTSCDAASTKYSTKCLILRCPRRPTSAARFKFAREPNSTCLPVHQLGAWFKL